VKLEGKLLSPNGIRAILFDLDGTLRYSQPSQTHAFFDRAVQLGVEDSMEKRLRAVRWQHYYWAQSDELIEDVNAFSEQDDLFWMNYARRNLVAFDCHPDQAEELAPQIHQYMRDEFKPKDWVPPDVAPTLRTLNEAGFRMAVLSNRRKPFDELLETLDLGEFFEFSLAAGEVNLWKPAPEIFHHVLDRLELAPQEAVYVGDNYYADVVGAQAAGIRPVLVDPEGVFPDAECPVIKNLGELEPLLEK
jgi:HAD superfamily hydrolase (TIGR01549 family)